MLRIVPSHALRENLPEQGVDVLAGPHVDDLGHRLQASAEQTGQTLALRTGQKTEPQHLGAARERTKFCIVPQAWID